MAGKKAPFSRSKGHFVIRQRATVDGKAVYNRKKPYKKGPELLEECPYCGKSQADRYPHRRHMCVDCGRMYERFRTAMRAKNSKSLDAIMQHYNAKVAQRKRIPKEVQDELDRRFLNKDKGVRTVMKECVQCKRTLEEDSFIQYKSKSTGKYETTTGRHTVCKECESLNSRAYQLHKTGCVDDKNYQDMLTFYRVVLKRGGKVPTIGRRMMGLDTMVKEQSTMPSLLAEFIGGDEAATKEDVSLLVLAEHLKKLKRQSYPSLVDAQERQQELAEALKVAGLYDESDKALEDWELGLGPEAEEDEADE